MVINKLSNVHKDNCINSRLNKAWFIVACIAIFIFSATYLGFEYEFLPMVLNITAVITFVGVVLHGRMPFDIKFIFIFEAMLLVSIYDIRMYVVYEVAYGAVITLSYLIGKLLVGKNKELCDKRIMNSYLCIAFGMFTSGVVDVIYTRLQGYFNTERLLSVWNGEEYVRTTFEFCFILIVSTVFFAVWSFKRNKIISSALIVAAVFSVAEMIKQEGRYCVMLVIIVIPCMILLYLYTRWPEFKSQTKLVVKRLAMLFAAIIVLGILAFALNLFGLKDLYLGSYLSTGGILENVRFKTIYQAFVQMPEHLNGGYDTGVTMDDGRIIQVHNMWLKYGDKYGVVVLFLLLAYKLFTIVDAVKLAFKRGRENDIKYLLIPAFLSINLYYSLEPNGYANRLFLVFGLLISGMIRGKLDVADKNQSLLLKLKP